jgi:catecholate siderophore receptor
MSNVCQPLSLRQPQPFGQALAQSLAVSALLVAPVWAADAEADLDQSRDIVVTADRPEANPFADPAAPYKVDRSGNAKLTEPLRDTPRSVTVVPREVIDDLGATSIRDLVRTQPGITLGTGEGGNSFGDRVFIRGFEARNDVYIDGQRDPGVVSREIFAVQQVEVLKGPAATIGGRGTTGGAVNIVSKQPAPGNFVEAEATGGTDATRRFTVDANRRVAEGVTVRLNALWHDAEVAGRDTVWNRRWGVAVAALLEPTEAIDLNLDYYHLTTDALPDWGIPFDRSTQEPLAGIRDKFYGLQTRDFAATRSDIATGRLTAELLEGWTLSSQTRWGRVRNSYIASAPENPVLTGDLSTWTVRANPKNRNAVATTLANVSQVTGRFATGAIRHTLVAGVELSRERIDNRPYAFALSETVGEVIVPPIPIIQPIFTPDPNQPWPLSRTLSGASTRATIESLSVFLLDTVTLSDSLILTLGARYDSYDIETRAVSTAGVATRLGQSGGFLNWNAGLTWKPVPALSLYAAFATSSNPSGEQIDGNGVSYGGLGSATVNLDPERNRSFEAGAKWTPGAGHLLITGALFRIEKTNARVNDPVTAGVQILAGKQRSQGVELGVAGNVTERWSLFGGYSYIDARVTESPNPAQVGGRFPNVPEHSASLLSTYEILPGFQLGGQVFHAGRRYGGATVAGAASLPPYWRFDAMARWRASNRVEVRLNLLNLADETIYDAIYRSATPFTYVAPGRSALLSV